MEPSTIAVSTACYASRQWAKFCVFASLNLGYFGCRCRVSSLVLMAVVPFAAKSVVRAVHPETNKNNYIHTTSSFAILRQVTLTIFFYLKRTMMHSCLNRKCIFSLPFLLLKSYFFRADKLGLPAEWNTIDIPLPWAIQSLNKWSILDSHKKRRRLLTWRGSCTNTTDSP